MQTLKLIASSLPPKAEPWFETININNSFSSNNASSSLSSNLSSSLTGNLCSNFNVTPNGHQNGSLNGNPNGNLNNNNPNLHGNGLSNNLTSSLSNQPTNGLTNSHLANNFSNNYFDYQGYNSSSNSSSIALNSDYDYNQQSLVTNLSESNLNSNVIPPFYPTFVQGVKEQQTSHPANGHRIDSLISSSNNLLNSNTLLSSNNSIGSNGSPYHQLDAPPINFQPHNHSHPQFNHHVQNNFLKTTNLPLENGYQSYRSPEQSSPSPCICPCSEEYRPYEQYEQHSKQSAKLGGLHLDCESDKAERRRSNNNRERIRVQKLNDGFEKLNKTCNKVTNKEEKLTKFEVLKAASGIISTLENQVVVSARIFFKACLQNLIVFSLLFRFQSKLKQASFSNHSKIQGWREPSNPHPKMEGWNEPSDPQI